MKRISSKQNEVRGGFTMVELMVVVAVIAVVASLVTGAAMKSIKQSREKRVDATIQGLQMALMNYRARENKWPNVFLSQTVSSDGSIWFHGVDNQKVFKELINGGSDGATRYLDGASLLVSVNGQRMTLLQALQKSKSSEKSIGYPWPQNQNIFGCFCVEYNPLTDSVKIHRPDMRRPPYKAGSVDDGGDRVEGDHTCPESYWIKVN